MILFCLMKKTTIWSNLFTPKQKLAFICVLCGSLVNRSFRDQKAVLFEISVFKYSKFLGRCDFISFDEKNCYMIQFIYTQKITTKKQFYSEISIFQYSKFLGRRDFISFDENNCYMVQFIYAQTKLAFISVLCGSLVNQNFRDQKAVLFRDFRLQIFQILMTLWFYFVWWK
jgi:hypothetical protein